MGLKISAKDKYKYKDKKDKYKYKDRKEVDMGSNISMYDGWWRHMLCVQLSKSVFTRRTLFLGRFWMCKKVKYVTSGAAAEHPSAVPAAAGRGDGQDQRAAASAADQAATACCAASGDRLVWWRSCLCQWWLWCWCQWWWRNGFDGACFSLPNMRSPLPCWPWSRRTRGRRIASDTGEILEKDFTLGKEDLCDTVIPQEWGVQQRWEHEGEPVWQCSQFSSGARERKQEQQRRAGFKKMN